MTETTVFKLTAARRRKIVAVATDVLQTMRLLNVERGLYIKAWLANDALNVGATGEPKFCPTDKLDKLLPLVLKRSKPCQVCGIGACMISFVKLYDHVDIGNSLDHGSFEMGMADIERTVGPVFGMELLRHIEQAFEIEYDPNKDDGFYNPYELFGTRYREPRARLRAIMKNIIANNGEFLPEAKRVKK